MNKLKPFQHCAVEYIYANFYSFEKTYDYFLLGDEGGLGKTVQALKLIEKIYLNNKGKNFLIICPANLKLQWIEFISIWLPAKNKRYFSILIETYSSILNPIVQYKLKLHNYDLMILDEEHYLINFTSQRTKFIFGQPPKRNLILKTKKVLALTATFTPNTVADAYPFFWAVKADILENLTELDFYKKYSEKIKITKWGVKPIGIVDADNFLKKRAWYLRRKIDDVVSDIPPMTRNHITLPIDDKLFNEEKALLNDLLQLSNLKNISLEALLDEFDYFETVMETVPGFAEYANFKKRQGLVKIKQVVEYLKENILNQKKKIIIASYHKDVARMYFDLLEKTCLDKKIKIMLVTGDIENKKRHLLLKETEKYKKICLICTLNSVREGKNLQHFSDSFITEIDWRWVVHKQFELRTRRIGSKYPVFYNYFLFDRGMDKKIFSVLTEKENLEKQIY